MASKNNAGNNLIVYLIITALLGGSALMTSGNSMMERETGMIQIMSQ